MPRPKATYHIFQDPDILLRASIIFPNEEHWQIHLTATDGNREYSIDNLYEENLGGSAYFHGYSQERFKDLLLHVLCRIQPPDDFDIPKGACLVARKEDEKLEIGLRPIEDRYQGLDFTFFAQMQEIEDDEVVGNWRWAERGFVECERLYWEVDQGVVAVKELKEEVAKLQAEGAKLKAQVEALRVEQMQVIFGN